MNWTKKEMPLIPGYESLGDDVAAKRWLDFKLTELLDTGDPVWEYRDELKTRKDICDFVIQQIDYPFHLGAPTDKHYNNWFDSGCCHQITEDYWQQASETLATLRLNKRDGKKGLGDCEDTSVLFVTLMLEKGFEAWECLGEVLQNSIPIGGHGWSIFKSDDSFWRIYESTLDVPPNYPEGYPRIDPDETSWKVEGLTYQAYAKFDRHEYYEANDAEETMKKLTSLPFKAKETRRKYEAIAKAWGKGTKPLSKANILSRARWK